MIVNIFPCNIRRAENQGLEKSEGNTKIHHNVLRELSVCL